MRQFDDQLARILEIGGHAAADDRLDLAQAPFRMRGATTKAPGAIWTLPVIPYLPVTSGNEASTITGAGSTCKRIATAPMTSARPKPLAPDCS
jgi:hypothetical protein